jgi:iron donor protein CyaY
MTKRDFIELSEKTFNDIEQLVDDQYPDVDFDREGNVLTLTLEDGKVVVINRQEAMEEMWLALFVSGSVPKNFSLMKFSSPTLSLAQTASLINSTILLTIGFCSGQKPIFF